MAEREVILEHPNRSKAGVKLTRVIVIVILLASVVLMGIVLVGGWDALAGQKPALVAYMLIYLLLAVFAARWNRGVLPVGASLGIVLAIFAAVAGSSWYDRHRHGFTEPSIHSNVLGTLCYVLIPVQVLLIVFASRGFSQDWHVEVERHADGSLDEEPDYGEPAPSAV
ncbi:MAG: hypothetical protein ACR2ND_06000 [Solirubrobacteraceae bacterium]